MSKTSIQIEFKFSEGCEQHKTGGTMIKTWRIGALATAVITIALLAAMPLPGVAQVGPGYSIEMSRMIPMRDGVELEAWISKPDKLTGKAPTVLEFTQYDIDGGRRRDFSAFVKRGFIFVQAYVRGRGKSGGVKSDNLGLQVGRDGYDVVEWIAKQPWSDGRVVMYGGSFVGMTQWRTAAQHPPHLAGIAPYVPIYPGWDIPNTNGIPQAWTTVILGITAGRSYNAGFVGNQDYWMGKMLEEYAAYHPFTQLYSAIGIEASDWWMLDEHGDKKPMLNVWMDHVGDESFNLAAEPKAAVFKQMTFPVLTATGFFDDDQPGTLRYYHRYMADAPATAVDNAYLVIGPWDHGGTGYPSKEILGLNIPEAAVIDMNKLCADWYDWVLGRGPRPGFLRDKVTYFMLGADEWRSAKSLDAASSGRTFDLFLSAPEGTPRDVFHSGSLVEHPAPAEPPATIVSDPHELPELEIAKYLND